MLVNTYALYYNNLWYLSSANLVCINQIQNRNNKHKQIKSNMDAMYSDPMVIDVLLSAVNIINVHKNYNNE